MTRQEFQKWLDRLQTTFPAVARYFDAGRFADQADAVLLATTWLDALHTVDASDASRAIDAMVRGDMDIPKFMDDWARFPGDVRRWCRDNRPLVGQLQAAAFTDDQSFRCLACRDRGFGVEVFNPLWVRRHDLEIERGELSGDWQSDARRECRTEGWGPFIYACDCSCEIGRRLTQRRKENRQVYYPKIHCLVPGGSERDRLAALAKFVVEHPVIEQHQWRPQLT